MAVVDLGRRVERWVAAGVIGVSAGGDYAYQMANATIFFLIAITLSLLQLRLTRGRNVF